MIVLRAQHHAAARVGPPTALDTTALDGCVLPSLLGVEPTEQRHTGLTRRRRERFHDTRVHQVTEVARADLADPAVLGGDECGAAR
jgi:hypothetical protein